MMNRCCIVARSLSCGERSLPIVADRCRSLSLGRDRWRSAEIVVCHRQKISRQFPGVRPSGLQQSSLDGLLASRPGALAGKAVWPICLQTTRTPCPARCVWPTWGLTVSACHQRRITSQYDWQPDVAGKPLGAFAGKAARPLAGQRGRVGWLQIVRPLRAANHPAQTTIEQRKSNESSTKVQRSRATG